MSLFPIGTYHSTRGAVTLYQDLTDPLSIKAKIGNLVDERLLNVRLPELPGKGRLNAFSIANKVTLILMNKQLYLNYSQETEEFVFSHFDPQSVLWETGPVLKLEQEIKNWICRFDGSLAYFNSEQITLWDWQNEKTHVLELKNVTALAENDKGALIIGDREGQLRIGKHPPFYSHAEKQPIKQILPINGSHYVVIFKDAECLIVDTSGQEITNLDKPKKALVSREGKILVLNQVGELGVYAYDPKHAIYEHTGNIPYEHGPIKDIQEASTNKIMILSEDEHLTVWDTDRVISERALEIQPNDHNLLLKKAIKDKSTIWLSKNMIAHASASKSNDAYMHFHTGERRLGTKIPGSWNVSSIFPLSNGSIAYSTESGIHVVSTDGTVHFSSPIDRNNWIKNVREITEGSIAVQLNNSFMILQPKIKPDALEDLDYKIEQMLLELRYHPSNLQLYTELAKLYHQKYCEDGDDKQIENHYNTLFSGLGEALKQRQWDEALKFYRKVRQEKPNEAAPCQLFLKYLELSNTDKHLKKEENLIRLELYKIQKTDPQAELSCRDKPCKERLFIGEGDFSYTEALLNKHKDTHLNLPKALVATELQYPRGIEQRIESLQKQGVEVMEGVDGTKIHETFPNRHFERIHWNCPFGDPRSRESFKETMPAFFESASQLQNAGDRIHLTLIDAAFRQEENPIVAGSTAANYCLVRKRKFGRERYPEYVHTITGTTDSYHTKGYGAEREFVFEKTDKNVPYTLEGANSLMDPVKKKYKINSRAEDPNDPDLRKRYFACSTDEDSSDYYASDESF